MCPQTTRSTLNGEYDQLGDSRLAPFGLELTNNTMRSVVTFSSEVNAGGGSPMLESLSHGNSPDPLQLLPMMGKLSNIPSQMTLSGQSEGFNAAIGLHGFVTAVIPLPHDVHSSSIPSTTPSSKKNDFACPGPKSEPCSTMSTLSVLPCNSPGGGSAAPGTPRVIPHTPRMSRPLAPPLFTRPRRSSAAKKGCNVVMTCDETPSGAVRPDVWF